MGGENERRTGTTTSEAEDSASSRLADDVFFRALAEESRRRLLAYLLEENAATLDDLAGLLVGWDTADSGTMASPEAYEQARVRLKHRDLPLLAAGDLVDYDEGSGRVSLGNLDEDATELIRMSVERAEE
ncbi:MULTISPECIES: DUF7344 domain-containing protein [Salinibaculum]|uniref:DUF7344 domain-containing protein n=1 Tax=Salinibaculum TaxID=2732368 RepID=UPI0030CF60D4